MSNWYRSLQDHNYLIRWSVATLQPFPQTSCNQFSLTVQAEGYDTCIADPQREERSRRMEEQMRLIRGFRGEGQTLRWEEAVSSMRSGTKTAVWCYSWSPRVIQDSREDKLSVLFYVCAVFCSLMEHHSWDTFISGIGKYNWPIRLIHLQQRSRVTCEI